jgi:hypothetical protein
LCKHARKAAVMGLCPITAEKTPDNTLTPNPYHVAERHRFDFMIDYDHDLRLIAHHVQCLKEIIAEIEDTSG